MKRKLCLAVIAVVASAACNETIVNEPEVNTGLVKLDLSLPFGETRSQGTDDERKVNGFQVYVFDSEGILEAYDNVQASTVSIECTPGSKQIVAFVNAPEVKDVRTYEQLTSLSSDFADNGKDNFVMTGEITADVTESAQITIPVSRIASKIILGTVTNNLALEHLKSKRFYVSEMFVINVAGTTGYMYDKPIELWYNKMKMDEDSQVEDLVLKKSQDSFVIPLGETHTADYSFYAYPNATETDKSEAEWSPRYTRLVLKAYISNDLYYYPVSIPNLERNTAYLVNVTITRPGSDSPDSPVDLDTASVSVEVMDWADAEEINEKI